MKNRRRLDNWESRVHDFGPTLMTQTPPEPPAARCVSRHLVCHLPLDSLSGRKGNPGRAPDITFPLVQ
ncbi:MAG: hypothetical protein JWO49_405 [Arthrobacter sp.]|nr:hypothetical protein [Arthrobacter sp.]